MYVSAKADYAIRAMLEIAQHEPDVVTADSVASGQDLPRKFIMSILSDLRRAGLVRAHRGSAGGYVLARPAREVTLGSIIRAVEGPLAEVRGLRPDEGYRGVATHLPDVWDALRSSIALVLDETTLHHVLTGRLPGPVRRAGGAATGRARAVDDDVDDEVEVAAPAQVASPR